MKVKTGMRMLAAAVAGAALLMGTAAQAQAIKDQYIVVLKAPALGTPQANLGIGDLARSLLSQIGGGTVLAQYDHALLGFTVKMTANQAARLSRLPLVQLVEQDQVVKASATQTGAPWGLDRIDQRNLPLNGSYTYPDQAGQGVNVYIIDTGLNAGHADFVGRIGSGRNFAPNTDGLLGGLVGGLLPINLGGLPILGGLFSGPIDAADTTDCNGHGTHVAGSAAGSSYGVAKKATLHTVRVLGCSGSGSNSGVIAGVDWVTANRVLPAVANMSLGGSNSDALDQAVKNAIAQGVTFVVAAGNDNANACTGSPNRVPEAVTVGATTNSDARSSFSNYGACVDVFAPGSDILSAWIGGGNATSTISGTSMASPHVAGAAALLLGADNGLTPAQVAAALVANATTGAVSNPGAGSPNTLLYVGN